MGGYFTFGHVGTVMVFQCRYAFKRHSVSHSGSCFLEEMRRTMSSFNPGGAESVSTSVKNPYLYSCLTKPSMASVAVLMNLPGVRIGSSLPHCFKRFSRALQSEQIP